MWYNSGISNYADINYKINKVYCDKCGYDLIKSDVRAYNDGRPLHWEKLPMILLHLASYDYVVWIDADAHFYHESPGLEGLIDSYATAKIIISADLNQRNPWELNSGFLLIKNDPVSVFILNAWAYNDTYKKLTKFPYHEQAILWYMYSLNLDGIRNALTVLPYGQIQHFYQKELIHFPLNKYTGTKKPFVHHNAGTYAHERYDSSIAYYNQHFTYKDHSQHPSLTPHETS
jgi:hypothetical protein